MAIDEIPYPSEYETVMAVQNGAVERAVVPIENSLEGSVAATLDALAGDAGGVRIVAEVVRPVSHSLVARPGIAAQSRTARLRRPRPHSVGGTLGYDATVRPCFAMKAL